MNTPASALSGRLGCYLINLDRAPERLAQATREFTAQGLPFTRIAAVDGRQLRFPHPDFSARSYRLLHGRRTMPLEVGCYLSHIAAIEAFLASDAPFAAVFEDDIQFADGFAGVLEAALDHPGDWDILRLTTVNNGRKFRIRRIAPHHFLALALSREKGAGGYVVNRRAARWIASLRPMRLAYDIAFDLEYLHGLKAAFVDPPICTQRTPLPTQIQIDIPAYKLPATRYLTVLPYRAGLEIARLLVRGGRWLGYRLGGGR